MPALICSGHWQFCNSESCLERIVHREKHLHSHGLVIAMNIHFAMWVQLTSITKYVPVNQHRYRKWWSFFYLNDRVTYSTALCGKSWLGMGWSAEIVTCHGSKHTGCYYPFLPGTALRICFSMTTRSPPRHHEKLQNPNFLVPINVFWSFCKILNSATQRPGNPQDGGRWLLGIDQCVSAVHSCLSDFKTPDHFPVLFWSSLIALFSPVCMIFQISMLGYILLCYC